MKTLLVALLFTTPQQVVHKQTEFFAAKQYDQMYETYSPGFKQSCPYPKWLKYVKSSRNTFGSHFTSIIKINNVKQVGSYASVNYTWIVNNQTLFIRNDTYIKIGKQWYDARDRNTVCPT